MLISLEWLKRYVELDLGPEAVAERIVQSGFDIDGIEEVRFGPGEPADWRIDVEVTWNRPDCQSHVGVAREVAGLTRRALSLPAPGVTTVDDPIDVAVEDPELCPLYTARIIRGVRIGPSPRWLVRLLEGAGSRSINNVVDVTNFVLLETGQPLHAFDLARLAAPGSSKLVARRAAGEAMTAIDGRALTLTRDDLVIADAVRPVALAGVMGGRDSEVGDSTKDIALESALFAPLSIRATSKRHQIRSDSSFRFERFVDPAGVRTASDRAAELMVELCGAVSVGALCEAGPGVATADRRIELRHAQVRRVLGIEVPESEVRSILSSLGCEESSATGPSAVWRVPSWRPDLVEEIDLVEEVARRVGFERVPDEVRIPVRPLVVEPARRALGRVRDAFLACGLNECVTEPFVGQGVLDVGLDREAAALTVENPMRSEESRLRRSLLGTLLRVARGNANRGNTDLRLFEIAPVYVRGESDAETTELLLGAGLVRGDFGEAKGCATTVLRAVGLESRVEYTRGAPPSFPCCRAATVRLDGAVVGHVIELTPALRDRYGLAEATSLFELRVDTLCGAARLDLPCVPVSKHPAVDRDLDLVVDEGVTWAALAGCVREGAGELLESLAPFDVYRGDKIGSGRKSVTLRMLLRTADRTLTAAEADAVVARVLDLAHRRTGGVLRA